MVLRIRANLAQPLRRSIETPSRSYARIPGMDREMSKLNELLEKFKDPESHYHIPPGTIGPQHEEDHTSSRPPPSTTSNTINTSTAQPESTLTTTPTPAASSLPPSTISTAQFASAREDAKSYFGSEGYDLKGILEWPVAWGDCDTFQHVNNVRYIRWIESARIQYAQELDLPEGMVLGMLSGKGTGFILKDVSMKYIRPVTWPDSVMIASQAHGINQEKSSFKLKHAIWSLKDNRLAAIGDSTMVMYDYDRLVKGKLTDQFRQALEARMPSQSSD